MCSSQVLLKMRMSSRYTTTKELAKGLNTSSINLMNIVGVFFRPKGMTIHSKIPSLYLQFVFIHQSVRWEPSGSQTLVQFCWRTWPPWVGQEGHQSWEWGSGSWLWFCLRLCNQCKVTKCRPSSAPVKSGFRKGRIWVWCAPFKEALKSNAWFCHYPSASADRLVH